MPHASTADKIQRTQKIISALKLVYPEAHCELKFSNPLQLLVATILSAQCTDVRVNKSWTKDKWKLTLFGEVINLTNRTNYIYDSFNGYNSKTFQTYLTLDTMFPILPSAGIVCER